MNGYHVKNPARLPELPIPEDCAQPAPVYRQFGPGKWSPTTTALLQPLRRTIRVQCLLLVSEFATTSSMTDIRLSANPSELIQAHLHHAILIHSSRQVRDLDHSANTL